MDRRTFLRNAAFGAAGLALSRRGFTAEADLAPFRAEIEKRHGDTLKMLQRWIAQPTIAAENKGIDQGCELTMQLFRDAGFDSVQRIPTDGVPGIFATLDAGAPRTVGLYFMYDVKQANPAERSSSVEERRTKKDRKRLSWRRCRRSGPPGAKCRSISSWWPKARKRSARHTFRKSLPFPRFERRCPSALASTCRSTRRIRTAWSRFIWARRASSRWNWSRAERSGGAGRVTTFTPASRPRWTAPPGTWCKRCTRWYRPMETPRQLTTLQTRRARCIPGRRR